MLVAFSGGDVRAAEAPLIESGQGDALMQRAAHGLFGVVLGLLREAGLTAYGATVVVLAGSGNNGADALYAGERLLRRGAGATAVLLSDHVHAASLEAFRRAGGTSVTLADGTDPGGLALHASRADVVIDGIVGTGAQGGLRGTARAFVDAFNTAAGARATRSALVVACDLPSGIDVDSGQVDGPVLAADASVTFGAAKPGLILGAGALASGDVNVVDIGLDLTASTPAVQTLLHADVAALVRAPTAQDQKYSRGVLGIAAGSSRYPGAAALAVGAALATGLGMVRYLGPDTVASLVHQRNPEAVASNGSVADARSQAWLVGPGAVDDDQRRRASDAIGSGLPVVVDAGALPEVPDRVGPQVILTPHAGELSQFLTARGVDVDRSAIEAEPAHFALRAAEMTGATVLLKGFTTVVAAPSGTLFAQTDASPWLSTAGSGDTLSGILGALAASLAEDTGAARRIGVADEDLWAAIAAAGAAIHGRAGRRAALRGPILISDLPTDIRAVMAGLYEERRLAAAM
ncbi:NAD(P)H-hydrate epimerase [Arthrobacter agilis]|uniref:NAD(P)H-hydrate epimerase n=1 Tax=Arthrobacter agilis TaxID=37921 RepID=UPI002367248A|nr:NAD(P)H-hydrate epimerase [Arthrobacter agilis]WDF32610.1 NAD(P)H-hydrate epimerase [Arthrobacter agilis]